LLFLLKKNGERFLPICPCAYAYVFWRQSLFGLSHFYNPIHGIRTNRGGKYGFRVISPLYRDELKELFDKSKIAIGTEYGRSAVIWLINKASAFLYLRLFWKWFEIAGEGAIHERVPRRETFKQFVHDQVSFTFRISGDVTRGRTIQFLTQDGFTPNINQYNDIDCKQSRKELRHMRSHTPLAVSMMPFGDVKQK
jgi:hypothetical protein